jgi:predicted transcriptional regulator
LRCQQLEFEELERAALAEVLKHRQAGKFVSAREMEERIVAMLARKREAHAVQD